MTQPRSPKDVPRRADDAPSIRPAARRLGILLSVLLWVAGLFLCGELVARLASSWTARHNRLAAEEVDRRVGLAAAFDSTLWEVPWRNYKPNARLETIYQGRLRRITTNSRGFRGPEVTLPKPPGIYRIVCVGGSTTIEGWTDETTYPALLQAKLRSALGSSAVEVVNAGISGHSTQHELIHLPLYLALEPDLIVEYGCINDFARAIPELLAATSGPQRLLRRSQLLCRLVGRGLVPTETEVARHLRETTFSRLREFATRSAAAGCRPAFASFAIARSPDLTPVERAYVDYMVKLDFGDPAVGLATYSRWIALYNRMLRDFCREEGHLYIPLAEEMPGEMKWYVDLCHMTDDGIERKAEILARALTPVVRAGMEDLPARQGPGG